MSISVVVSNLENNTWTSHTGPSINPAAPDGYQVINTPAGLYLAMCSSVPYGGWLASTDTPLLVQATTMNFLYSVTVDDLTAICAQVIETDTKLTDSNNWTYDCSSQWNYARIPGKIVFQIDNASWTWVDTPIVLAPFQPGVEARINIQYAFDYTNHNSSIISVNVNGTTYPIPINLQNIPAQQVGWGKSDIHTQLQQCNNSKAGAYELRFRNIGYQYNA